MVDASDTMRLRAEVIDDASDKIKNIQKAMKAAHAQERHENAEHNKQVRERSKAYKELGESVKAIAGGGIGDAFMGIAGGFGAVGVAIGAAVIAIDKAADSVRELGKKSADLSDLSRQANMTTDAFQKLESQMTHLNISKEKADASLSKFGGLWADLSSRHPTNKAMSQVEDGDLAGVYERYVRPNRGIKDTATAYQKIVGDVKSSGQSPEMQARILEQLGIDPAFAYKSKDEIAEANRKSRVAMSPTAVEVLKRHNEKEDRLTAANEKRDNEIAAFEAQHGIDALTDLKSDLREWAFDPEHASKQKFMNGLFAPYGGNADKGAMSGPDSADTKKVLKESTAEGTKQGMIDAWREIIMGRTSAAELFAGGYQPMAYHPDGGGRGGGFFGSKDYPAVDDPGNNGTNVPDMLGGNSRGNRNNNRGNMKMGALAKSFGATHADDKGFAVFPDQASGDAAHDALLKSNAYKGLTLDQFGNKYSEGNADWKKTVGAALGIGPNDIVNNNDPRLAGAIRKAEGTERNSGIDAINRQFSADARHMDPMAPVGLGSPATV